MQKLNNKELLKSPDALVEEVVHSGYNKYVQANFENATDRLDDLKELANFAHSYHSLTAFLTDVTLREGFRGESWRPGGEHEDE